MKKISTTKLLSKIETVAIFLQSNQPSPIEDSALTMEDLENLIIELSENASLVWIEKLKECIHSPIVLQRMKEQLGKSTLEAIYKLLLSKEAFQLVQDIRAELNTFEPTRDLEQLIELEFCIEEDSATFIERFKTKIIDLLSNPLQFEQVFQHFSTKGIQVLNQVLAGDESSNLLKTIEQFKLFFLQQDYPEAVKQGLDKTIHTGLLQFLVNHPKPPFSPNLIFQTLIRHIFDCYQAEFNRNMQLGHL